MSKKVNFNDRWCKNRTLPTGVIQEEFTDSGFKLRGVTLGLKVGKKGGTYFVRYFGKDKRRKFISLGLAADLSLSEAREKATDIRKLVKVGQDPLETKRTIERLPTLSQLWQRYDEQYAAQNQRAKTRSERNRLFSKEIEPRLGNFKINEIKRSDVISLVDEISTRAPVLSRRVRACITAIFRFALDRELIEVNPCHSLPRMSKLEPRSRVLTEQEIKSLWKAFDSELLPHTAIQIKLLFLTGQRSNELCSMKWEDIEDNLWFLKPEKTKNKKSHVVPLSQQALNLLNEIRELNKQRQSRNRMKEISERFDNWVFPARGKNAPMLEIRSLFYKCAKKAEVENVSPHDLRRTAATHMRRIGIRLDVVSAILNHSPSDVTRQVYGKYNLLNEKRDALEKWSQEIIRIILSENDVDKKLVVNG